MHMLTRKDWIWLGVALVVLGASIAALLLAGCGDDDGAVCPDSLASTSAKWSAGVGARAQCAELADSLNSSGINVAGDDDSGTGECTGRTSQSESGGMCRATIASSCEGGLSFELECTVRRDRTADCDVRIEAPELEDACSLRVLLR